MSNDNLTRPHPLGPYGAGGQAPAPQDLRPEPLELDAGTANRPVREVTPGRRLVESEPVRLYLRPLLVALLGLVTAYGLVDDTLAPAWLALIDAGLAVGGWLFIERVRGSVYSPRGAERKADRAARAAAAAGRDAWASTVRTETSAYRLGPL